MLYVYIGCFVFGIIYAGLSAILGGHDFGHDGIGGGMHGESGGTHADAPSPFSPLVIASAITAFGAAGIVFKAGLGFRELYSALLAFGCSMIVGAAMFYGVVRLLFRSQSNSAFSQEELVGTEAEVITPLPAKGMGEIACIINGVRINLAAKSAKGDVIPRGEIIKIKEIHGGIAFVSKKVTIDDFEMLDLDVDQTNRNSRENVDGRN